MISFIYSHHSFITGCAGNPSSKAGSPTLKQANSTRVPSSKNIEYSRTPASRNKASRRGQIAACRRRYSSSNPGNSFIVKAIRCITKNFINPAAPPNPAAANHYLTKAIATPPSTFNTFPVDLFINPPTSTKHALAISSGKMISFNNVLLA
jgi:hypothetical protein